MIKETLTYKVEYKDGNVEEFMVSMCGEEENLGCLFARIDEASRPADSWISRTLDDYIDALINIYEPDDEAWAYSALKDKMSSFYGNDIKKLTKMIKEFEK